MYTRFDEKDHVVLIYLYVHELIVTRNSVKLIDQVKEQVSQVFEMKDHGELHYCLGLEVLRDVGQNFVTQGKYVKEVLKRFNMDQCKVAFVLMQQNVKLHFDDGSKEVDGSLYRQLVGSLNYRLTTTRTNITYSINVLINLWRDLQNSIGEQQNNSLGILQEQLILILSILIHFMLT